MSMEYPLTKANRLELARSFRNVPRVDISIECVLEGQMGKVFVDNVEKPSAYKIQVGPFFYFAGKPSDEMLKNIKPYTLFMPSSQGWLEAGQKMYGERLHSFDRYSFSSGQLSREQLQNLCQASKFATGIKQMDIALITRLWGQGHFIDVSDFESPADFIERGIGYYLEQDGAVIGAAYSSLVCSKGIEVSLFVTDEYRQQGIATSLSAHLINWTLSV